MAPGTPQRAPPSPVSSPSSVNSPRARPRPSKGAILASQRRLSQGLSPSPVRPGPATLFGSINSSEHNRTTSASPTKSSALQTTYQVDESNITGVPKRSLFSEDSEEDESDVQPASQPPKSAVPSTKLRSGQPGDVRTESSVTDQPTSVPATPSLRVSRSSTTLPTVLPKSSKRNVTYIRDATFHEMYPPPPPPPPLPPSASVSAEALPETPASGSPAMSSVRSKDISLSVVDPGPISVQGKPFASSSSNNSHSALAKAIIGNQRTHSPPLSDSAASGALSSLQTTTPSPSSGPEMKSFTSSSSHSATDPSDPLTNSALSSSSFPTTRKVQTAMKSTKGPASTSKSESSTLKLHQSKTGTSAGSARCHQQQPEADHNLYFSDPVTAAAGIQPATPLGESIAPSAVSSDPSANLNTSAPQSVIQPVLSHPVARKSSSFRPTPKTLPSIAPPALLDDSDSDVDMAQSSDEENGIDDDMDTRPSHYSSADKGKGRAVPNAPAMAKSRIVTDTQVILARNLARSLAPEKASPPAGTTPPLQATNSNVSVAAAAPQRVASSDPAAPPTRARKSTGLRASFTAKDLAASESSVSKKHVSLGGANKGNKMMVIDLTLSSSEEEGDDSDDDDDAVEIVNALVSNQVSIPASTAEAIADSLAGDHRPLLPGTTVLPEVPGSATFHGEQGTTQSEASKKRDTDPIRQPRQNRVKRSRFPHFHKEDQHVKDLLSMGIEPGELDQSDEMNGPPGRRVLPQRISRSGVKPASLVKARRARRRMEERGAVAKARSIVHEDDDVDMNESASGTATDEDLVIESMRELVLVKDKDEYLAEQQYLRPISRRSITGPSYDRQQEFYEQAAIVTDRQRVLKKRLLLEPGRRGGSKHDTALYEAMIAETLASEIPCQAHELPRIRICPQDGKAPFTPPFEFVYTNRVIYDDDIMPTQSPGCNCAGNCATSLKCSCRLRQKLSSMRKKPNRELRSGVKNFAYTAEGLIRPELVETKEPIWECNSMCGCGPECVNRVVGQIPRVSVDIFWTGSKGWGVRNPRSYEYTDLEGNPQIYKERVLPLGTPLGIYAAELMLADAAWTRDERASERKDHDGRNYLFGLDHFSIFEDLREILRQTGKIRGGLTEGEERQLEEWAKGEAEYGLDAMFYGSWTRFCNHSCSRFNTQIQPVYIDDGDLLRPIFLFVAARDIQPGEDIAISYCGGSPELEQGQTLAQYKADVAKVVAKAPPKFRCFCGEVLCRGVMFRYGDTPDEADEADGPTSSR